MTIAQSKTREQFPLSTKKIVKKTLASAINSAVVILIFLFLMWGYTLGFRSVDQSFAGEIQNLVVLVTAVLLCGYGVGTALNYFYQRWYFAVYFYDLTPDFIQIRKGPITPREITIPYERIQDVYVDQDIYDRMFGLYDVHISSATASSGMAAHIDGVEKQAADGLRAMLLETVKQRISKGGNSNPSPSNSIR